MRILQEDMDGVCLCSEVAGCSGAAVVEVGCTQTGKAGREAGYIISVSTG